jgi:uncharacterized protein YggE
MWTMKDKDKHGDGTLDVSGIGRVTVVPDEATVHLTVITEGKTAGEAVAANAKQTQSVIEAVTEQPNHGVTTSGLGVTPVLEYDVKSHPRIVGYRATNSVIVKSNISHAGQVFDAGVQAGANESSGLSFGLNNDAQYREDALRLAVRAAFLEARAVAKAADVELDGPETISIEPSGGRVFFRTASLERSAPTTPVLPEDLTITATVRLTFRTRI